MRAEPRGGQFVCCVFDVVDLVRLDLGVSEEWSAWGRSGYG